MWRHMGSNGHLPDDTDYASVGSYTRTKLGGVSNTSTPEEDALYQEVWVEGCLDLLSFITGWLREDFILTDKETFLSQCKASARVQSPAKHFQMDTWGRIVEVIPDTLERLYRDRREYAAKRRADHERRQRGR